MPSGNHWKGVERATPRTATAFEVPVTVSTMTKPTVSTSSFWMVRTTCNRHAPTRDW